MGRLRGADCRCEATQSEGGAAVGGFCVHMTRLGISDEPPIIVTFRVRIDD